MSDASEVPEVTMPSAQAPGSPPERPRLRWVVAALLAQSLLVGVAVAPALSPRLTGQEYRMRVAPVDPIDPFRGAYVQLEYPGLPAPPRDDDAPPMGTVYVPLAQDRSTGLWKGTDLRDTPPDAAPYLTCESDGWRLKCGIDSWFVPQQRAAELERAMREDHAVAVLKIDSNGHAAITDLIATT